MEYYIMQNFLSDLIGISEVQKDSNHFKTLICVIAYNISLIDETDEKKAKNNCTFSLK